MHQSIAEPAEALARESLLNGWCVARSSTGSASHLRFHPDNCHAQCVHCNRWGAGKAVDYRIRLIRRIGPARVEELEADNAPHKWTREGLIEVRDTYRAKLKDIQKGNPC